MRRPQNMTQNILPHALGRTRGAKCTASALTASNARARTLRPSPRSGRGSSSPCSAPTSPLASPQPTGDERTWRREKSVHGATRYRSHIVKCNTHCVRHFWARFFRLQRVQLGCGTRSPCSAAPRRSLPRCSRRSRMRRSRRRTSHSRRTRRRWRASHSRRSASQKIAFGICLYPEQWSVF